MAQSKFLLNGVEVTGASDWMSIEGARGVIVQISGTFEGTVQFEATVDGQNAVAVGLVPLGANTTRTTTATAAGIYAGMLPGVNAFRVNVTDYTSGAISAHAHAIGVEDVMPAEQVGDLTDDNIAADADIAGSKLATNARVHMSPITPVIDLSGSAVSNTEWLHFSRAATLVGLYAVYVEAASADDGVVIDVGKQGNDDYFAAYTTKKSATANEQEAMTLLKTDIAAGDTITYNCAGSKTGTGSCFLLAEYVFND